MTLPDPGRARRRRTPGRRRGHGRGARDLRRGTRDAQRDVRDRACPTARRAAGEVAAGPGLGRRDRRGRSSGGPHVVPTSTRACYSGSARRSVYAAESRVGPRGRHGASPHTQVNEADAAGLWTLQTSIFPENRASLALHDAGRLPHARGPDPGSRGSTGSGADTVLLERRSEAVWSGALRRHSVRASMTSLLWVSGIRFPSRSMRRPARGVDGSQDADVDPLVDRRLHAGARQAEHDGAGLTVPRGRREAADVRLRRLRRAWCPGARTPRRGHALRRVLPRPSRRSRRARPTAPSGCRRRVLRRTCSPCGRAA